MDYKEKVLLVHNYYKIPGGEDSVVANEKQMLEENGHQVVFYSRHNNELDSMSKVQKLLLPFNTIFNFKTIKDIVKIIKTEKIDIVHVHNTLTLISPAVFYAAVFCKVPVVQTIHNFRMLCPGATFYRDGNICEDCVNKGLKCAIKHKCYRGSLLQTLLCVISTKIHRFTGIYKKINYICLTEFNKEKLLLLNKGKRKVIDENKVFIKPNFTFESKYQRLENEDYYLFIGRVEQIKGLDLLLDAFAMMPDKKLRIAGTGTELEYYKKSATPNVSFLGFLDREGLSLQLAKAKAVIVPSQWYETFGMIIAEAYSAHCPVIVGDIGNIAGLVEDGKTGIKFKYNDSNALVEAISRMEKSDLMGEKSFVKFKNEFSQSVNYRLLRNIYEETRK